MRVRLEHWLLAAILAALGLLVIGSVASAQPATPPPEPASLSLVVETDPPGFEGLAFVHVPGGLDAYDGTPGQVAAIQDPFPDALVDNPVGPDIPAPSAEYLYPELAAAMSEPFSAPWTDAGLEPGRHSLVLARAPAEARPTSVRCFEQGERGLIRLDVSSTPGPRLATIDLRPGDAVECIFSIDMRALPGSLSVSASGDVPAGDEDPVFLVYFGSLADVPYDVVEALTGDGGDSSGGFDPGWPSVPSSAAEPVEPGDPVAFRLPVGESRDLTDLPTGPRTIMLTDLPAGLTVEAITCTGEPDTPVAITGNGPYDEPRVALVGITAANAVGCDFVLAATDGQMGTGTADAPTAEDVAEPERDTTPDMSSLGIVPRAGRWDVVNLPASITCGGQTFDLRRTTDKGTVEVRRDGDRIIAQGIGEGRGKTTLDRVSVDPSVFRGRIKIKEQGVDISLAVTMEVPKRTRIAGTMSGGFKAGGVDCKLNRDFTAKFAGK